jgi:[ribosomal protein S18]-alanine N-acetyltransferase
MRSMHEQLSIRLARNADATRIAALSRATIEYGLGWSWTPQRVLRSIGHADTNVAVALAASGEFGGFGIMEYHDQHAHLALFAVDPAFRRQGLGTAMLQWLESCAVTAGIRFINLEARATNAAAQAFYARYGYEQIRVTPGYYSGREPAVHFVKELW